MEAFKTYLEKFPHYTPAVVDEVRPYLSSKTIPAGEYLLRQGKICKSIAFIETGLLRLYYLNDGKEVTTCFCKENTITCSYSSLITQKESEIAIQSIEESKLTILPYVSLQKLYATSLFWQQVGRMASENEFMISDCHNRFIRDLSATERYLDILKNDPELLQRIPLNYLATYLQISPETLSRIRKKIGRT